MTDIYLGEYGRFLYAKTGADLSSADNITIRGSTSGASFANSASVSVLPTNFTASAGGTVFSAGKSVRYKINAGDFSKAGLWRVHLEVDLDVNTRIMSVYQELYVSEPGFGS